MKTRFQILAQALGCGRLSGLARELGVDPSYITKLYKSGSLNAKFRENLSARFPRANLAYLEYGEGEPLLPETPEEHRQKLITAIQEVLDLLDPPIREIVLDAVKKYRNKFSFKNAEARADLRRNLNLLGEVMDNKKER